MRGTLAKSTSVLALSVLLAAPLAAEQTGEIRGTITDATGATLPGVLVTARSPSLQGVRTTTSDASGFFRLPALPNRLAVSGPVLAAS